MIKQHKDQLEFEVIFPLFFVEPDERGEDNWTAAGENPGRVVLVGLKGAGKSTLLNRLYGWAVTDPAREADWISDFGLFCLVDLPDAPAMSGVEQEMPVTDRLIFDLAAEADLLIYLLDAGLGLRAADQGWLKHLRRLGKPLLIVLNKGDLPGVSLPHMVAQIEARLAAPLLAVSARTGWNVPGQLLARMVTLCPELALPLERTRQGLRRRAAERLIRRTALFNGLISLQPIPLLDIPFQALALGGMTARLAALYGQPPASALRKDVLAAIAGGLGGRYALQQIVKLIPGPGWLASGLIALTCAWLFGWAVVVCLEAEGKGDLIRAWLRLYDGWGSQWHIFKGLWQGWMGGPRRRGDRGSGEAGEK